MAISASAFACDGPGYGYGLFMATPSVPYTVPYSSPSLRSVSPENRPESGEVTPLLDAAMGVGETKIIAVRLSDGRFYYVLVANGFLPAIDKATMTVHYRDKIKMDSGYQQQLARNGFIDYSAKSPAIVQYHRQKRETQEQTFPVSTTSRER